MTEHITFKVEQHTLQLFYSFTDVLQLFWIANSQNVCGHPLHNTDSARSILFVR